MTLEPLLWLHCSIVTRQELGRPLDECDEEGRREPPDGGVGFAIPRRARV